MLRLNKLTDYSTVIMSFLARHDQQTFPARDIAQQTHISLPTVSKIVKQLARQGLLISERGVQGGYGLAQRPQNISLVQVIDAMEDCRVSVTECGSHVSSCQLEHHCSVRRNWQLINTAIRAALESITIADLAKPLPKMEFTVNTQLISKQSDKYHG